METVFFLSGRQAKGGKKRGAVEDTKDVAGGPKGRRKLPELPQRSSSYRGVTRHRWTGRYEAHLWDSSCLRNNTTGKGRTKGRQVSMSSSLPHRRGALVGDAQLTLWWLCWRRVSAGVLGWV